MCFPIFKKLYGATLKVKSAGGTSQEGVNMASKWRIDGEVGHAH